MAKKNAPIFTYLKHQSGSDVSSNTALHQISTVSGWPRCISEQIGRFRIVFLNLEHRIIGTDNPFSLKAGTPPAIVRRGVSDPKSV